MDVIHDKHRLSDEDSASAAEGRPQKRQILLTAGPRTPAARSTFTGIGIQHSGFGNMNIGGNLIINTTNHSLFDEEDSKCLRALRTTDPRDDKDRIEKAKGGLLHDAYAWVLDNNEFIQWYKDPERRLLWVKGEPGKGKTMLLCGIINELSSTKPKVQESCILLSYFFCQATDTRINTATAVLRGLIYMLISQQPTLISHIRKTYNGAGEQLFKDINAWEALSRILASILEDPCLQGTYVIIDALDECTTDRDLLLSFIQKSTANSNVNTKWIVSSRNWTSIEKGLRQATQKVRLSLELNERSVSAAVTTYIEFKINQLANTDPYNGESDYNDNERDTIQHYLFSNAQDTFLWVALACEQLVGLSGWEAVEKLKDFPPGLDTLYQQMLKQIRESRHAPLCNNILSVILVVYRPINLDELPSLVNMPAGSSGNYKRLAEIIGLCGSFLTIRDCTISIIHQSASDFLLERASNDIFPFGRENIHHNIFSRSLQIMSKTLHRDIYSLGAPGYPIEQVIQPNPDPLAPVRYSCVYWVDHLYDYTAAKKSTNDQDYGFIDNFLRQKYLCWLESLSLLRSISGGIRSIAKLDSLLKGQTTQVTNLVHDGRRFFQYFRWIIENSPLQIYNSALVFSPARSIIKSQFKNEEPKWVVKKPIIKDHWDTCLQALEGHTDFVNSVAFSHDSKLVASASNDRTVRIWFSDTGALQQTLEGHTDDVTSVAFSHDSKLIASASYDETVRIWSSSTGHLQQTLEGHTDHVTSVAFSHDSMLIASASCDRTVRIWFSETGDLQKTLEGHTDDVRSVAFSHDSKLIVSASYDETVRIWSNITGHLQQILQGHTWQVTSVVFSHDSKLIASASWDRTVRIWSRITGDLVHTLDKHTDFVWTVAFSHDSKLVASASVDTKVRIWSSETGALQRTFEGHTDTVRSVAFSHDSKLVASASCDKTIRIWSNETMHLQKTFEGHTSMIYSVVFSHDSKLIASASWDGTVRIWSTETGALRRTLEGHIFWVMFVAFSHDSKLVASASRDMTVRIWSSETGDLQHTLEGHTGDVRSVVFSHDSKLVASASRDKTVRIWCNETGDLQKIFEGHNRDVYSVVFSSDSKLIASASKDRTVRIWSNITGHLQQTLEGHTNSVTSVAFSHDSKLVASASEDETVRIWSVKTGNSLQTINLGIPSKRLVFSQEGSSYYLITDIGALSMESLLAPARDANATIEGSFSSSSAPPSFDYQDYYFGYGLSKDRCWITLDGKNLLWLPADTRPSSSAVSGSTVVLGCGSGRIIIMQLSANKPPKF